MRYLAALAAAVALVAPPSPVAQARLAPRTPAPAAAVRMDAAQLRAALEAATAEAERAGALVLQAAARTATLRAEMDRLADELDVARAALGDRARAIYMHGQPDPITQLFTGLALPDLAIAARGYESGAQTDEQIIADVEEATRRIAALRRQADLVRVSLLAQAAPVFAAQDRARSLYAAASAAEQRALAALRDRLDALSADVTDAVAPAVTARGRRAKAAEEPIIRLLEQTGRGMPPGYHRTGVRITGIASWYGPGFVGNPTATGAPYDPERLTAAMLPPVRLGTVVRVTSDDGLAINVLVNDRGPYGKGRVIDLSRAAARWMGFTGLKRVTVELLEPD